MLKGVRTAFVVGVLPQTESEWIWILVAAEFEDKWNFNHCIGACDGKHISIEKPPGSGSLFYNYKRIFQRNIVCCCQCEL
ncbi:hypothetical protein HF086_009766 [Spodoptera exigua]|uniref:DDE Tnp4 domain-containing protein n=1 Tax=Spodoptera exigua TaxID=7107 RepID=A0A922MBP0_SPOEX|nr:hypothetical protein HF086_009766 [Spodoptera exigua]